MNRPWQVWLLFLGCLAVVVAAMGWLTYKALELDDQVMLSARQADLDEDISLALWRMDVALAPLVAQEAARPYLVYRPFLGEPLADAGMGNPPAQPSPLLVQPSEFVRLHFEMDSSGELTSPQCPAGALTELAVLNGAPLENIIASRGHLALLSEKIAPAALASRLPSETLPPAAATDLAWDNRQNLWNFNPVEQAHELGRNVLVQGDSQAQQLYAPQMVEPQQPGEQQQLAAAPDTPEQASQLFGYGRAPRQQAERGELEFQRRNRALQSLANTEVIKQRKQLPPQPPAPAVQEGVSAPLWIGGELLLARRVGIGGTEVVQGCWFDWPKLKQFLIAEGAGGERLAADVLPKFDLKPIVTERDVSPARRLATLPVEIAVAPPKFHAAPLSPIRLSLWIAWACMILAAAAVAVLLQGVVTLSERRGAFVSAVTHELRTPLTTFRMYAEMLSEGMVRDPAAQKHYTDTLRVEADRLWHLVENVLAYARLERGRRGGRREMISLEAILERIVPRLADRAEQAGMRLVVSAAGDERKKAVFTDPQAVEQILFNLVDNACKYAHFAEDRRIYLEASVAGRTAALVVRDHGPGISKAFAKKLFEPFSKSAEDAAASAPGVGLGMALCRRLAREIGGSLELVSLPAPGAAFRLTLPLAADQAARQTGNQATA